MPFRLGPMELVIVLVIVMVVFGIGKLPQVGNSLGKAIKEFRNAQTEAEEVVEMTSPAVTRTDSEHRDGS